MVDDPFPETILNGRRSQPMTSPHLVHDAESLIRSLDGVAHVRIMPGDSGIEAIHVTARDDDAARFMAGHVRSALLAGLATPVTAGRIHVRVDPDAAPEAPQNRDSPDSGEDRPPPRHRIRLLEQQDSGLADGAGDGRGDRSGAGHEPAAELAFGAASEEGDGKKLYSPHNTRRLESAPSPVRHPRLVAVDIDRPGDGRVLCRVAVAHASAVFRAEAVAVDLPGAAAQAAAQATVRALIDAGIEGLQLNGLREVEIAGHEYVIVALRREDNYRRHRSGSAPIIGSPERSAAQATVAAAVEML